MRVFTKVSLIIVAGATIIVGGVATPAQALGSFEVLISAPRVQGPDASLGALELEELNVAPGACPVTWWSGSLNEGTLSGPCTISTPTGNGGANSTSGLPAWITGSPATNFGAATASTAFTVTLQQDASYFGLWWSGGDKGNTVTLFKDGIEVASFTNDDLLNVIYKNQMGTWKANDFMYIPVYGYYKGQPFAYVNFVAEGGATFDSFEIKELNPYGWFEFDNVALVTAPVVIDEETTFPVVDGDPVDVNGNGIPDIDEDADGDGIADPFEDTDGDGMADAFEDSDGDGVNDYAESFLLPDTGSEPSISTGIMGLLLLLGGAGLVAYRRRLIRRQTSVANAIDLTKWARANK